MSAPPPQVIQEENVSLGKISNACLFETNQGCTGGRNNHTATAGGLFFPHTVGKVLKVGGLFLNHVQ